MKKTDSSGTDSIKCPSFELLKLYKIFPREIQFDYLKTQYFIYVYLNPFKELKKPIKAAGFCFGFEPFYIGKGAGTGYRQNHHVQYFANRGQDIKTWNSYKLKKFEYIERKLKWAQKEMIESLPWNWEEYKKDWIVIIYNSNSPQEIIEKEMQLISDIGVQDGKGGKKGPLVNRITTSNKNDRIIRKQKRIYVI